MAERLEEQSSVRSFGFDKSLGEQPIVLKPTALPFLERVIGAPPVIEGLVPGRPVKGVSGKDELAAQAALRDLDEAERRSIGAEDGQKADVQEFKPESYRDLIERINLVREMIADGPILLSSTEGDMMFADLFRFGYRLTRFFVDRLGNVPSSRAA